MADTLEEVLGKVRIRWAEGNDTARIIACDPKNFTIRALNAEWTYSLSEVHEARMRGKTLLEPLPRRLVDGSEARVGPGVYVDTLPWGLRS